MVDTNDEWIVQRTGIRERRIVDENEATSDLAVRAAQQALERANLLPEDVEFIAVGTTSPDMIFPTTANIVQHRLGCRRAGSVDMLAACAGSIYSLSVGSAFIQSGKYKRVLCIGAETLSRITDFTDRGTCVLLADAAGAAVLEASEDERGIIDFDLYSDGQYWDLLYMPGGGSRHPATKETVDARMHFAKMKGQRGVQGRRPPVRGLRRANPRAQRIHGEGREPVHSASGQFEDHRGGRQACRPPDGRGSSSNVDRYGNTGAASVYVALEEANARWTTEAWRSCAHQWPSGAVSPWGAASCGV